MLIDRQVQETWVKLLAAELERGEVRMATVEQGYHLVVRRPEGEPCSDFEASCADFAALESRIPDLRRTRAVYLNSGSVYGLHDLEATRAWAGNLAREVESGRRRAFAVVDVERFRRRVEAALSASGWAVEDAGEALLVRDGRFEQQVSVLGSTVRMVLSRSSMKRAARRIVEETGADSRRDAAIFHRFAERFRQFRPGVLDRFFVAYPENSHVALGWDYSQISGKSPEEGEQLFERGMENLDALLRGPLDDLLPELALTAYNRNLSVN